MKGQLLNIIIKFFNFSISLIEKPDRIKCGTQVWTKIKISKDTNIDRKSSLADTVTYRFTRGFTLYVGSLVNSSE